MSDKNVAVELDFHIKLLFLAGRASVGRTLQADFPLNKKHSTTNLMWLREKYYSIHVIIHLAPARFLLDKIRSSTISMRFRGKRLVASQKYKSSETFSDHVCGS